MNLTVSKNQRKNHSDWRVFIIPALVVMILSSSSCSSDKNGESTHASGGGNVGKAAIPVQTALVERGDISIFLLHTTTIEAAKVVDVVTKVAGHVVKLQTEEGKSVKKGQLLAQLNEAELKIDLIQAKVKMETDRKALERSKNMLEKNLLAKENFDTAQMQYESSKAAYAAAKLKVEYTEVRAPISGIVTSRQIELGQRIAANQALFTIADFEPLRARIHVPEKNIMRVFVGQAARITADAVPGKEFAGKVTMISPVVDPANGTVKVTIDIDGAQNWLKPGMFASIYITTEKHENTLLIPKKAILLESENEQVYLMQEGRAHKVALQVGFSSSDIVEVLQGLEEGQRVVTIGQDGLREGLPIKDVTAAGLVKSIRSQNEKGVESGKGIELNHRRPMLTSEQKSRAEEKVDLELLAQLEKEILDSRMGKRIFEMWLQEEPEMANDPAKKMAWFSEFIEGMLARISNRAPEVAQAFKKEIAKDPDMETNLLKQYQFLQENFRKMRGDRR